MSSVGCMDTEPDGLESILAGNEEGAKGCCLSVDMTADGIAVLSSDGYCVAADGTQMSIADYSYAELHQAAPQLIPAGQAIELARTCQAKIAITVHNQTLLPQLRMTLAACKLSGRYDFRRSGIGGSGAYRGCQSGPAHHGRTARAAGQYRRAGAGGADDRLVRHPCRSRGI